MSQQSELLVVGAGPGGFSAALAARSLGIDVTLLEAEPQDRIRPGSRALYVHHETLCRLERMSPGTGAKIAGFGIRWQVARTYYRGREIYARHYDAERPAGLPAYASLRQVDTERFLLGACRDAGVRVEWGARVTQVHTGPHAVTAVAADGREWNAEYLIGADGARSAVREALSIAMDGGRSSDYRVAVDVALPGGGLGPAERIMHYRHPRMHGRNLLIVPFAGGMQVDVQCVSASDGADLSDRESVLRWLPRVVGPACAGGILWIARYPCLQRIAVSFADEHRRALLIGEAAHLFVPLGARGMNSAIADAEAASTAVAVALRATGPERARGAIEDFARFRRQAADANRGFVDQALRHLRRETLRARLTQAAAAYLAPVYPRFGEWMDKAPYGPRGVIAVRSGLY
jgi:3-(3-hydroxy-phenyl)propionate hydroxylase